MDKAPMKTGEVTCEDRRAAVLHARPDLLPYEEVKRWIATGERPVFNDFESEAFTFSGFESAERDSERLARHRIVTCAGLKERVFVLETAVQKARQQLQGSFASLVTKQRGPGLSPAEKVLFERLGKALDAFDEAKESKSAEAVDV